MDYIKTNKEAWEEAFEHRHENWGDDNDVRLANEELPFFNDDVRDELKTMDFTGKTVAQFCCNNGRELLSIMQRKPKMGVGFDIAENILDQARTNAAKAGIANCDFIATNILEIEEEYYDKFDFIFFTIGAITWFKDLALLFDKVAKCLRPGGILLINDFHPLMNMLATPDEEAFDPDCINKIVYPYFNSEPWIDNNGMEYMAGQYPSKTFTCFTHTISELINSVINAGMAIKKWNEYNYDVGLTDIYDNKEYPLSYIMVAQKN